MSLTDNFLRMTPRTGKLVDSTGNVVNEADSIALLTNASPAASSRQGKLYRAFWTGSIPSGSTYDFTIDIPVGYEIYGVSRDQTLGPGVTDITFLVGGTYTTVADTIVGYNFDEVLEDTAVSTLKRITDLVGASPRAGTFHQSPTNNPRRFSSNQTDIGAQPRFSREHFPVFRYENTGVSSIRLALNLTWQEFPIT